MTKSSLEYVIILYNIFKVLFVMKDCNKIKKLGTNE